ncbi:MAG: tetratricopeptide repeat protein [Verrucomicrobiota bacterium]|nr:tetratricopeptide repeat protein [Verrucomicrobiota bacterium]
MSLQEQFDDAMFDFSTGQTDAAIEKLQAILAQDPNYFDAQLSLGGAYFARGDFAKAIVEGHKAEKMKPNEQLVHTNLSRAYMKIGDKKTAEHHGLQARIALWKGNMTAPDPNKKSSDESELEMAQPKPPPVKMPEKFPDMPWKKKSTDSGKH